MQDHRRANSTQSMSNSNATAAGGYPPQRFPPGSTPTPGEESTDQIVVAGAVNVFPDTYFMLRLWNLGTTTQWSLMQRCVAKAAISAMVDDRYDEINRSCAFVTVNAGSFDEGLKSTEYLHHYDFAIGGQAPELEGRYIPHPHWTTFGRCKASI